MTLKSISVFDLKVIWGHTDIAKLLTFLVI